ncbi:UDP-N-acetylglucosamine 1-carboxyvinyltransferase [bacterium]|nr:UDP-N-acetylglucosamine 1-carboxyvinyltransferase [bacterium]MCG2677366.1 UDP-N-acetylglucosamine 1-carboxyvinyltransferase [bacterium]
MERIIITGGERLKGRVRISGSKNAALPIMAATLLTNGVTTLSNIPRLKDVTTMARVLRTLGAKVEFRERELKIDTTNVDSFLAPYNLVKTMRASFLVFGPLLAKLGRARVSLPGGCAIGSRPVDLHLRGFEELGAEVSMGGGYTQVKRDGLMGAEIYLDFPSVGATENLMMAATLAKGKTIIENAAKEPEIVDLANFLNKMGAKIKGAGTDTIEIIGIKELKGTDYSIIPDRIEAGTYMIASAITRGDVTLEGARLDHLEPLVTKLREIGVEVIENEGAIEIRAKRGIKAVDVKTLPYPGFPTDMQAQFMALMSITPGMSIITETVFENRFMHVSELARMGADIKIEGASAIVKGVKSLSGAPVMATDLRASAALILAGLVAKGKTEISRIYHLDRGYERIEEKLSNLGAKIERIK